MTEDQRVAWRRLAQAVKQGGAAQTRDAREKAGAMMRRGLSRTWKTRTVNQALAPELLKVLGFARAWQAMDGATRAANGAAMEAAGRAALKLLKDDRRANPTPDPPPFRRHRADLDD